MNWIDTPLFVYAYVEAHPAQPQAEEVLRAGSCASSVLNALEVFHVLVGHYVVAVTDTTHAVGRLLRAAVRWAAVEPDDVEPVLRFQERYGLASADAVLLHKARAERGVLVTPDRRLLRAGEAEGLAVRNPVSPALAQAIASWEADVLPPRGLPRILRTVEQWLHVRDSSLAEAFRDATANGTSLPV